MNPIVITMGLCTFGSGVALGLVAITSPFSVAGGAAQVAAALILGGIAMTYAGMIFCSRDGDEE